MKDSINKALRWALIPALLVYVASLSLSGLAGIKGQLVLRDLAHTCGTPAGVGLLSNLGYLLWLCSRRTQDYWHSRQASRAAGLDIAKAGLHGRWERRSRADKAELH